MTLPTHREQSRARLAWHLSFWMPGLGQLYNRHWIKGAVLLTTSTLLSRWVANEYPMAAIGACLPPTCPVLLGIEVSLLLILWVWGICDAGQRGSTAPAPNYPVRGQRSGARIPAGQSP